MMQVRSIIEDACKARRQILEDYSGQGRQGMMSAGTELQQVRKATESRLATILTPEQMEEYRKLIDEQVKAIGGRRGGRGMGRF